MKTKYILKMNLVNRTLQRANALRHLSSGSAPKIQERIINACKEVVQSKTSLKDLLNESIPSENKWDEVRKQFSNSNSNNAKSVDALIVNVCAEVTEKPEFAIELVKSYLNYLRANDYEVNIAVANRTLSIFNKCKDKTNHEELVIWLYDNIYKKYPVLDATSANVLVKALCETQKWQEAEAYVNLSVLGGILTFAATCFRQNQAQKGWKYLNVIKENPKVNMVSGNLVKEFIYYCKRNFEGEALHREMSTFATFFREMGCLFTAEAADEIVEHSPAINYTAKKVNISHNGICPNCKKSLMKAEIEEEEYLQLQKHTLENIVVAKNVYKGTNPEELKNFIKFVDNNGPYDFVVDALNLYYKCNHKNIIPELIQKIGPKKILIVSRFHLKKQLKTLEEDPNVSIYYVDDLTKDDAFILYAALKSGLDCKIITNDFMRAQKFLLSNTQLRNAFKKWQIKNHLQVQSNDKTKKLFIKTLIKFPVVINEDPEGWHIPRMTQPSLQEIYKTWHDWICLRK